MAGPSDFTNVGHRAGTIPFPVDTREAEAKFNNTGTAVNSGRVWKAVLITSAVIAAVAAIAAGVLFFVLAMPVAAGIAAGVTIIGLAGVTVSLVALTSSREKAVPFSEMSDEDAEELYRYAATQTSGFLAIPYKCDGLYKVIYKENASSYRLTISEYRSLENASKFFREKTVSLVVK